MKTELQIREVIQLNTSEWKFPDFIGFQSTSDYLNKIKNVENHDIIVFDLSDTNGFHSSFLGFLLDMKQRTDDNGGQLVLKLSPPLTQFLENVNLLQHFCSADNCQFPIN